jgi:type I restriction enzyme S subunit
MRLKFLATLAYGDSLSTDNRSEGDVLVYGSNGPVGTHDTPNTIGKTIIVGRKGSYGKLNISKDGVFAIDTTYYIDRRFTTQDIDWLFFLLCSLRLDSFSKDSAVPGLDREDAYERLCAVPSLPDQKAIASYLLSQTARIDELIGQKQLLLELIEEQRHATITRMVTRGLEASPDNGRNGVGWFRSTPGHWSVSRVKFLIELVTSGSRGWAAYYSDDGATFLQSGNIGRQMQLDFSLHQRVSPPPGAEGMRTAVNIDDVLVCITGARTGAVGHVSTPLGEAYINQHIALLRPDKERVCPRFLAYSLWSSVGREQLFVSSYGLKEGLGLENVLDVEVAYPSVWEQAEIVAHLDDVTSRMNALSAQVQQAIGKLLEFRSALITSAVTGKIDVRASQNEEAAA